MEGCHLGMTAINGIGPTLWDINGKRFTVPIFDILAGRVRNSVRIYSHVGGEQVTSLDWSSAPKCFLKER